MVSEIVFVWREMTSLDDEIKDGLIVLKGKVKRYKSLKNRFYELMNKKG